MRTPEVHVEVIVTSHASGMRRDERAVAAARMAATRNALAFTRRCAAVQHEEDGLLEQVRACRDLRNALAGDSRPGILLLPVLGQFYEGEPPIEAFFPQIEVGDCVPVLVR